MCELRDARGGGALGKEDRRRREEEEEGVEGGGKENLTSTTQRSRCAACVPKVRIYVRLPHDKTVTSPCVDARRRRRRKGGQEVYPRTKTIDQVTGEPQPRAESKSGNKKAG
jgi:hypothetical protein